MQVRPALPKGVLKMTSKGLVHALSRWQGRVFLVAVLAFVLAIAPFAYAMVDEFGGASFSVAYAPYTAGPVVTEVEPYAPYTAGPVVREEIPPYAPYTAGPVVPEEEPYAPYALPR